MSKRNVKLQSLFTLSEIISPSSDREKIKQDILSERIDWLAVVEIENTHFLTAALYFSLLEKDLLNFIDYEELLIYLEQIYTIKLHRFILTYPYFLLISCKKRDCKDSAYHINIAILSPNLRLIHAFINSEIVDRHYSTKTIDVR